jgi:hypothetical protein
MRYAGPVQGWYQGIPEIPFQVGLWSSEKHFVAAEFIDLVFISPAIQGMTSGCSCQGGGYGERCGGRDSRELSSLHGVVYVRFQAPWLGKM